MPSLQALKQFKASFQTFGNEPATLVELQLPMDDLALPGSEPEAAVSQQQETEDAQTDESADITAGDGGDEFYSENNEDTSPGTDFFPDLSELIGDSDYTDVDENDTPVDENIASENDFNLPPDLLNGLADEIEAGEIAGGEDLSSSNGPMDNAFDGVNIDGANIGDSDFADSDFADGNFADGTFADGTFADEASDDQTSENLAFDDFPDFNLDDSVNLPGEEAAETPFDLPDEAFGDANIDGAKIGDSDFADSDFADSNFADSNFADIDFGNEASDDQTSENLAFDDFPDFNLDDSVNLPGEEAAETPFDLPDEAFGGVNIEDANIGDSDFADSDFADIDFGNEASDDQTSENLAFDDFPDFNLGESQALPDEESSDVPFDFPLPDDIPAFADSSDAGSTGDEPFGGEDLHEKTGFELSSEGEVLNSEGSLEGVQGDSFDGFSMDTGSLADDLGLGADGTFDSLGGFSIPGLDLGTEKPKTGPGKKSHHDPFPGEIDEISLSGAELEQFLATLSSYPLNLRVACEELIAEKTVAPEQMSKLLRLLVNGAPANETASLAGKMLDRSIPIPKGYEKKTGEALETEQSSFAYIFIHSFLPVLRLFLALALVLLSAGYLGWSFIYRPLMAEKIYKLGIERIEAGEYSRANERFLEAFRINEKKPWFYTYARAFRDARQYTLSEEKYKQLLNYTASKSKRSIPEKEAVLEYADLQTNYIGDYQTADSIIRRNILDYFPWDQSGLLALGDNNLAWGEYESERLENARESYAMLIERYGRSDPLLERMLKYFIRTDNLGEVLQLQSYFMAQESRKISPASLTEMGGYFLDKRLEKVRGVPNEYLDYIGGIREILLRAIMQDPLLPESYYHLARYYNYFQNLTDERYTLEVAVRAFNAASEESPKRIGFHINSLRRYSEILTGSKEFFPAEENLMKAINIYQDALSRRLINRTPEFGKLYADLGDLEYFVKDGNMQSALDYYTLSEQNGWAPSEVLYRMGAAHYQLREWGPSLDRLFAAYRDSQPNRRILYALGNVSFMRGNYFAAQGYYDRLLEILDADRSRFPQIAATDNEEELDIAERLMVAQNNLGVTMEALAERTGNSRYHSRAQGLYSDSERAWDVLTRNPSSMIRMRPSPEITAPGVNPAYLNVQNSLHPISGYEPQFFLRIDKDILEPSIWEDLAPSGYRLSEGIHTGR